MAQRKERSPFLDQWRMLGIETEIMPPQVSAAGGEMRGLVVSGGCGGGLASNKESKEQYKQDGQGQAFTGDGKNRKNGSYGT